MVETKKAEKAKLFFIVGMRRSGTSILRRILASTEGVGNVLFEPHEIWHSVQMQHFRRFRSQEHKRRLDSFRATGRGKWHGAKFALNPGIDALDWIWLPKAFPEAKFIFITRNVDDCYESYRQQDKDSRRGAIPKQAYSPLFAWLTGCLWHFADSFPERAVFINYDKMIGNPSKELAPVFKLLKTKAPKDLAGMIKMPEQKKGIKKEEDKVLEGIRAIA